MRKCLLFFTFICAAFTMAACSDDSDNGGYNEIEFPSVSLSQVSAFEEGAVTVLIAPDSKTASYEYVLATEAERGNFENGSLEGIVTVSNGDRAEYTFTDLQAVEGMTLFARAYDSEQRMGAVASLRIDISEDVSWMKAETKMISATVASFEFTLSPTIYRGSYCIAEQGLLEEFENDGIEDALLFEEITASGCSRYDLVPETGYSFYMKGYDRLGKLAVAKEVPFTTLPLNEVSGVELDIISIDAYKSRFDIVPNANTSSMVAIIDFTNTIGEVIRVSWRDNFVDMFNAWGQDPMSGAMVETGGTMEVDVIDRFMALDISYTIYVLTYDLEGNPLNFQTLSYDKPDYDPELPKATIESIDITPVAYGGTFVVTPSDDALAVCLSVYTKATYDELVEFGEFTDAEFIEDVVNRALDNADGYFRYGNTTFDATTVDEAIAPGTELILLSVPLNANGLQGVGDLYKNEFTSL